jgi:hypothetical protein
LRLHTLLNQVAQVGTIQDSAILVLYRDVVTLYYFLLSGILQEIFTQKLFINVSSSY